MVVNPDLKQQVDQAVDFLKARIPFRLPIGVVLGSGLGRVCEMFEIVTRIDYREIPHFPVPTVEGHKGEILVGRRKKRMVMMMRGRVHFYEGYNLDQITFPVRIAKRLGVTKMVVTNSAGSVTDTLKPGDLMLIEDHIGVIWNPVFGEPMGVSKKPYYSRNLIALAERVGLEKRLPTRRGVLFGWRGPMYETPAEAKISCKFGGDAVTMSTIPEVICCNKLGIDVVGISLITNVAGSHKVGHNGVIDFADRMSRNLGMLILGLVDRM
ncbi:MAG: purine-nucleoside phosphorylase [bacterium]